jgi:hypothetical protein
MRSRLALALWMALAACGQETPAPAREGAGAAPPAAVPDVPLEETRSPNAQLQSDRLLREAETQVLHPGDGGGRASLVPDPGGHDRVPVGTTGRFTFVYEAGEHGIQENGAVFFVVNPFWGWSPAQIDQPEEPGFVRVESLAKGVTLRAVSLDERTLGVRILGRRLEAGEQIRVIYGAGRMGAFSDRFAEKESRFLFYSDADGDGVRALLAELPEVTVRPGPPARLVVQLASTARPGERARATVAVLDQAGDMGPPFDGAVALRSEPPGLGHPAEVALGSAGGARATFEVEPTQEGVYRLRAEAAGGLAAESNPLWVRREGPRILWGDLHGHSNLSDGTGTPEDYYAYAREVADLDVVSLTDHDHWGAPFLDKRPALWQRIREATQRAHHPGRFVTLLGYEWTSWLHGHRHVLYFEDAGEILSSFGPATDTPAELWTALRGRPALTFAHHSAGGPVATNWAFAPDPELEPLTEIVSVHGSSEALDAPHLIHEPVPGNFVRDVLAERGYRLGFVGSGDSHDGHPGLPHLVTPSGGLAGIFAEVATREAVLEALRARRTYATNGPRIALVATLDGQPNGSVVAPAASRELRVQVAAPGPLRSVELVRGREVVWSAEAEGRRDLELRETLRDLAAGEFVYVRVIQEDGGAAWSSPFFVE